MGRMKSLPKFIREHAGILVVLLVGLMMQMMSAFQYHYVRNEIMDDLGKEVDNAILIKTLKMRETLKNVEVAINYKKSDAEQSLGNPDLVMSLTREIVEGDSSIVGCGLAFVENYFPGEGRLFEPYSVRRDNGKIETMQLANENHDYTKSEYFQQALAVDTAYWFDPYMDDIGAKMVLTTYSYPIVDKSGHIAAIMQVDVPVDWLGKSLNRHKLFPSSYAMLLTGEGELISGPTDGSISRERMDRVIHLINDNTVKRKHNKHNGINIISFYDKEKKDDAYIYYKNVKGTSQWLLAVVNYDSEMYAKLYDIRKKAFILMIFGLMLFALILHFTARSFRKLNAERLKSEQMAGELRVASKIQQEMLPKRFPPYPERNDLDIYGTLVGAKEVDGDLYDFFIRDEKLFFCIGDVSGKGIPSALVMTVTHSLFRSISAHESNPARIIESINEFSTQGNDSDMFVTFFLGILDLPTGRLRYCNAGHDLPFIIGEDVRQIEAKPNLPIAVIDGYKYVVQEEMVNPGEMILLYTDGITEAMNVNHKQYSLCRLIDVLKKCKAEGIDTSKDVVDEVKRSVAQFVMGAEQSDDQTLLAFRYTPQKEQAVYQKSLIVTNSLKEVTRVNDFIKQISSDLSLDNALAKQLQLAIEEAAVNVIEYAYPEGTNGDVEISVEVFSDQMMFKIIDGGVSFAPTDVAKADTTLSVEDRPIGGLGVFLVRSLMDKINYERINGKNILTMWKQINLKL